MRSLLTGYAGAFNRRHERGGHLFQNRYKSIVVEAEPYLQELVRYLHLNPLRAQVVADLRTLDRYPWTGHSALLGTVPRAWQDTATILAQFGPSRGRARKAYRTFVADGIPHGRRPELQGGGLMRSLGGWHAVVTLRRGREAYAADERILGSSAFVEALQQAAQAAAVPRRCPRSSACSRLSPPPPGLHPTPSAGPAAAPKSPRRGQARRTSGAGWRARRGESSPRRSASPTKRSPRRQPAGSTRQPAGRRCGEVAVVANVPHD